MEDPDDIEAMVTMMKFIEELVKTEPMREFYGSLIQPGPEDDWEHTRGQRTTASTTRREPA